MANIRITDVVKDLPILNQALQELDRLSAISIEQQLINTGLQRQIQSSINTRGVTATNNVTFSWAGSSSELTWATGFARDSNNKYYPIPAGSSGTLSPSTHYWIGWNPSQQTMSFQTSLNALAQIPQILVLCNIFTGTTAQAGAAGGGGTEPGLDGPNGLKYKNF